MSRKKIAVESAEPKMVVVDGVSIPESEYLATLEQEGTPEPEVTVLGPGLADGLSARETENARNAMGIKDSPIDQAILDAARAPKKVKAYKAVGALMRSNGTLSARATHDGWCVMTKGEKRRDPSDPGSAGLEWLRRNGPVSFEMFAERFPINHLNWDINRGWVALISVEEAEKIWEEQEVAEEAAELPADEAAELPAEEVAEEVTAEEVTAE